MKKLLSLTLVAVLSLGLLAGCNTGGGQTAEKKTVNIAAVKGPTGMGMVSLMDKAEKGETAHDYKVTLVNAPDEIVSKVASGEVDIAAVGPNQAAALYQKTNKGVKVAAVHTIGNLAILSNNENIKSIKDLKGKTIYSTGQGATPEYAFNYLLEKNGLDPKKDVKMEFKSNTQELAALMTSKNIEVAVLPHPFATTVMMQNDKYKEVINLNDEWAKVAPEGSKLTTGVLIVRNEFLESNKDVVNKFLEEYKTSTEYVNANTQEAATLIEKYDILKAAVAQKALPKCGITYIEGDEMVTVAKTFIQVLYDANPQSVGGAVPDENFYYKK